MIAGVISFFIANLITSWIGSELFTGKVSRDSLNVSNKKWKSFSMFFIGFCVIFLVVILNKKV